MQSDKKKRIKKEAKSIAPFVTPTATPTVKKDEEKPSEFDFGGLPSRDLKKNLGCG